MANRRLTWSKDEIRQLQNYIACQYDLEAIQALMPKFTVSQINCKIRYMASMGQLDNEFERRAYTEWFSSEVAILEQYYPFYSMAYLLKKLTRFNKSQIISKAKMSKIKKVNIRGRDLTDEEADFILRNSPTMSLVEIRNHLRLPMSLEVMSAWLVAFRK